MDAMQRTANGARPAEAEIEVRVDTSIVVPTYNERPNVGPLLERLRGALNGRYDYEIIFVDDSSPDGTAGLVQQLGKDDPRVRLVQRPGKLGLGSAVVTGFQTARGEHWLLMDADLSHRPEDAPALLGALEDADIAIGSRYVLGGAIENWPLSRRVISRTASWAARRLVGIPVRDLTSGFAAFRAERVLPVLPVIQPRGFKVVLEILAHTRGLRIREVPITFTDRRAGASKFSAGEVVEFGRLCLRLRRTRRAQRDAAPAPSLSGPSGGG
jgi:dolichol-phosphate mannosyltransferase